VPCITISRLSYTSGGTIAEKVARSLSYELLSDEVFREASSASDLSEDKLWRAFREPPTFFGMSSATRKRAIAHVSAALAKHFLNDGVVYHGPFGHVIVPGVSHVLKVQIVARREDRVAAKVEREPNLSKEAAEKAISREDTQRSSLEKQIFGVDENSADLFDLVVDTSQMDIESATETIVNTVKLQRYQPMTYSIRCMENLELSLRIRACLAELDPDADVVVENGDVRVRSRVRTEGKQRAMREKVATLEGVNKVEMEVLEDSLIRF
jgi:cytidylate kinase